jgi:hypothetical protein
MKTKLIALALALLIISGCATTPKQRLYDSKVTFLGVLKTINVLKDAGRFDEKEVEQIRVFAKAGAEIISQWERDGDIAPDIMSSFETIIEQLLYYETKGRKNE